MRRFQNGDVTALFSRPLFVVTPGKTLPSGGCVAQRKDFHVAFPNAFPFELLDDMHGLEVLRIDSMHLPDHFLKHLYFAICHWAPSFRANRHYGKFKTMAMCQERNGEMTNDK